MTQHLCTPIVVKICRHWWWQGGRVEGPTHNPNPARSGSRFAKGSHLKIAPQPRRGANLGVDPGPSCPTIQEMRRVSEIIWKNGSASRFASNPLKIAPQARRAPAFYYS